MEEVELSDEASVFESEDYFSYINDINDETLFWDAVKNNMDEYSDHIFKGRLFHRFLGLNHDLKRPITYSIYLFYTNYYTHNLGSYHNSATGVKWPNYSSRGARDPDNTYCPKECDLSLTPFYRQCLQHIGTDPHTLFEDVGTLSCLMELAGSMEILLLNWYRQRPHLLSALTPHEFSNKMISHVYQAICEKLWQRPLDAMELDSIRQALSPLIETDFQTFKQNPDIIDSTIMPFRARDFPLQNFVFSRVYIIHLALACPDKTLPHFPAPLPHSQSPQQPPTLHDRCYRYRQLIEETIKSPLIHNVEHCLQILKQEDDTEIRFALEEILLDRLSSLKDNDAFISASFQLMDDHAESIYHKALFCSCVDVLYYLDKHYQPSSPFLPNGIHNSIDSIFQCRHPISLRYWFHHNESLMRDSSIRLQILRTIIRTKNVEFWQEYAFYCQRHQLSALSFAIHGKQSFFSLVEFCESLPLLESILLCLQEEIHFKTHLPIPQLAHRIYLHLIQPGDMLSPGHNLALPSEIRQPASYKVQMERARFLLHNPPNLSLPNGGLNFYELFLAAFHNQDHDFIEKILRFAKDRYPSLSQDQLWHYILPPDSKLYVHDHDCA